MQSNVLSESTADLMHNWANWSREKVSLGYTPCPMFKEFKSPDWEARPASEGPPINKDAERIEAAISIVAQRDRMLSDYIIYRWLFKYSCRRLGVHFHNNKNISSDILMRAESTLEGVLWSMEKAA